MKVSILMPVRDAERWLDAAVASIRAQTWQQWELLAVDDGSRDGSLAMLDGYARGDGRIRVLRTGTGRRGIVPTLNLALGEATGEFVARMDADDTCEPSRLQKQVTVLETEPALAAVTCCVEALLSSPAADAATKADDDSYEPFAGMRRYLAWQNSLLAPAELCRDRFVECPLVHPTLMMRTRRLRDELGGWQDNGWAEDWDLVLRAFEEGWQLRRLPETLYRWRLHELQTMRTDPLYAAVQFRAARCHYLARHLRGAAAGRDLWVLGAGPTGKLLARGLFDEGVGVAGFADVDPRKIGGRIRYAGADWPVVSSDSLLAKTPRPFALAAVGSATGRSRVRDLLTDWGWQEGVDFLAAA